AAAPAIGGAGVPRRYRQRPHAGAVHRLCPEARTGPGPVAARRRNRRPGRESIPRRVVPPDFGPLQRAAQPAVARLVRARLLGPVFRAEDSRHLRGDQQLQRPLPGRPGALQQRGVAGLPGLAVRAPAKPAERAGHPDQYGRDGEQSLLRRAGHAGAVADPRRSHSPAGKTTQRRLQPVRKRHRGRNGLPAGHHCAGQRPQRPAPGGRSGGPQKDAAQGTDGRRLGGRNAAGLRRPADGRGPVGGYAATGLLRQPHRVPAFANPKGPPATDRELPPVELPAHPIGVRQLQPRVPEPVLPATVRPVVSHLGGGPERHGAPLPGRTPRAQPAQSPTAGPAPGRGTRQRPAAHPHGVRAGPGKLQKCPHRMEHGADQRGPGRKGVPDHQAAIRRRHQNLPRTDCGRNRPAHHPTQLLQRPVPGAVRQARPPAGPGNGIRAI
ncbi:MAG: Efflux transport system, outer membrane factor (OMF) lipoprotein, partial [uncultured Cytophagales bacterium]